MILIIPAYKPAGGFSCIEIKDPSGPGTNAKAVDLVGHNFRGTTNTMRFRQEQMVKWSRFASPTEKMVY
jgi:hypothetical protein